MCSRRISSSCSSSGTRRVTISAVCCSYILGVSYIGGANRSTSCTPITFLKFHTNYCIKLYRVHLTTGGNRTRKRFFFTYHRIATTVHCKSRQYKTMKYTHTININGLLLTEAYVPLFISVRVTLAVLHYHFQFYI